MFWVLFWWASLYCKSLIQFSADEGAVLSLKFGLRPNYGRVNGSKGDLLQNYLGQYTVPPRTAIDSGLWQAIFDPHLLQRLPDTHR